jgi:hypothetical protein
VRGCQKRGLADGGEHRNDDDQFKNAPSTPWLWAPKDLAIDPADGRQPAAPSRPSPDRATRSSLHDDIRKRAAELPAKKAGAGEPLSRHGSNDSGYHSSSSSAAASARRASHDSGYYSAPPSRRTSRQSEPPSRHGSHDALDPGHGQGRERERRASSRLQHSSAAPIYREPEPEAFTSRQELQPTFSPKVVRTPHHYLATTPTPKPDERRRGETAPPYSPPYSPPPTSTSTSARRSHSRAPSRSRTMPEGAELVIPPRPADWDERMGPAARSASQSQSQSQSRSQSRTHSRSASASTTPTRSPARTPTSATSATFSALSLLTEEPSAFDGLGGMLSPLLVDRPVERDRDRDRDRDRERRELSPTPHARALGRSQTYPSAIAPAPAPGPVPPMPPVPARPHASAVSSSSAAAGAGAPRSSSTPYPRSAPHNPLPAPPVPSEIPRAGRATVSASSQAYSYAGHHPSNNTANNNHNHNGSQNMLTSSPPRGRRRGFWNRRGDHLTADMYVVYAPHALSHPEDLADYPHAREGYRDEYGTFVPWDPNRPELPDSLPRMGRAPLRPYESVSPFAFVSCTSDASLTLNFCSLCRDIRDLMFEGSPDRYPPSLSP